MEVCDSVPERNAFVNIVVHSQNTKLGCIYLF